MRGSILMTLLTLAMLMVPCGARASDVDAWRSTQDVKKTTACLIDQYVQHRRDEVPRVTEVGDKVMLSWETLYIIVFVRPDQAGGAIISHNHMLAASWWPFRKLDAASCGVTRITNGSAGPS